MKPLQSMEKEDKPESPEEIKRQKLNFSLLIIGVIILVGTGIPAIQERQAGKRTASLAEVHVQWDE